MTERGPDDDEVARLLRAAGEVEEPLPAEVAARLDDRLAALVAERGVADRGEASPPVPLSARRRRRAWAGGVLAAAAVVLGGYSLTTLLGETSVSGTADDAAVAESAPDAAGTDERARPDDLGTLGSDPPASARDLPALRSGQLAADVQRLLGTPQRAPDAGGPAERLPDPQAYQAGCSPPGRPGAGAWYAVRYDGRRALLLVRERSAGDREALVYTCAGRLLDRAPLDG